MAYRIQIRRDTSSNWTSNNPILLQGEFGYELNTGYAKIGDGQTAWTASLVSDVPPGSSGATGSTGEIALDTDWLYVCVGTDTWKRTLLTGW